MDRATLEEANRLRESMGMKPLPIPGQEPPPKGSDDEDEDPLATLDGRHAAAFDNYKKVQEADQAKQRREERAEAVKRAREKAQRHALLEGKTLGDLDEDEVGEAEGDAKAWLRGQKKRQKKIGKAEQKRKAAEEAVAEEARRQRRRAAGVDSDDDAHDDDLTGVKVGHDMATLLDGDDQILTLKDATVLENEDEGDELENLGLREREQLEERLNLKKKRHAYDPMDDDDAGAHAVLGQYDEEISGKKRKHFTLDPNAILGPSAGGGSKSAANSAANSVGGKPSATGVVASIQGLDDLDDIVSGVPSSDYIDVSEIKIKKPKKTAKTKKTRKRGVEDDEGLFPASGDADADTNNESNGRTGGKMDIDDGSEEVVVSRRKRKALDAEELLRDDDELQETLAGQRRETLKKRKRTRPEDIAKQLREADSKDGEDGTQVGGSAPVGGGLIIDETAEFVSNLKRREDREDETPRPRRPQARASSATAMEQSDDDDDDEDVAMKDEDDEVEDAARHRREGSSTSQLGGGGLEEEKKISEGMGATLSILRGRGILEAETEGDTSGSGRNRRMREHQQFLVEKRLRLARLEEEARRKREQDRE